MKICVVLVEDEECYLSVVHADWQQYILNPLDFFSCGKSLILFFFIPPPLVEVESEYLNTV